MKESNIPAAKTVPASSTVSTAAEGESSKGSGAGEGSVVAAAPSASQDSPVFNPVVEMTDSRALVVVTHAAYAPNVTDDGGAWTIATKKTRGGSSKSIQAIPNANQYLALIAEEEEIVETGAVV